MPSVVPVQIERSPWFDEQPASPRLPEDRFCVDFALWPAEREGKPTLALLGAYRIPGRYAELYGGRTFGALRIVAVDPVAGQVYHGDAMRPLSTPLSDYLRTRTPEPPDEGGRRIEASSHFNVDLRGQLALPEAGAAYPVFVWFDELVSPVRLAEVPGEEAAVAEEAAPIARWGMRFGPGAFPDDAGDALVALSATVAEGEGGPASVTVAGAVRPEAVAEAARRLMVVFAKGAISRRVYWRAVELPEAPPAGQATRFAFELDRLIDPTDWPQRYFLTAWAGRAVARPVVLHAGEDAKK